MSNRAYLSEYRKTYTHDPKQVYMGVEISDDFASTTIELDTIPDDDLELLRKVTEDFYDEASSGIIDHIHENSKGMFIRGTYYEWEQLKPILIPEND